jgi:hypothetical protein
VFEGSSIMGCYVIVMGARLLGTFDDDNAVIDISVTFYQSMWHSNSEDLNLEQCHCENLRSCRV